jgi:hypothetical protein
MQTWSTTRSHRLLAVPLALIVLAAAACGQGPAPGAVAAPPAREITRDTFQTFGDYIVHFSAQSTTMLPADVARAAGIRRSNKRAMLSIAVLHQPEGSAGVPVSAKVAVQASNLLGQYRALSMREIREENAIYYIGEFAVSNEEIVNFDVQLSPEGEDASYEFKFQQQFYTD